MHGNNNICFLLRQLLLIEIRAVNEKVRQRNKLDASLKCTPRFQPRAFADAETQAVHRSKHVPNVRDKDKV